MKRDKRNNYAVFWQGRYQCEQRGYREALRVRHEVAENFARHCASCVDFLLIDTPACTLCSSCGGHCAATLSKEVRS